MMMSWERYSNVAALKANMEMVLSTIEKTLRQSNETIFRRVRGPDPSIEDF
ncbi:hypothetical protein DPMN_136716 [Dreissena polymorpha]|uniref:Uncharacterized protein n=1 Tax=Dreissena polymorpha TaxID=45954 RepID=A0A9D4G442_DREPO|nr:hypothetical protein DPMN_136716 [Dreissena polymorpha]